jgi:hypothetical protein
MPDSIKYGVGARPVWLSKTKRICKVLLLRILQQSYKFQKMRNDAQLLRSPYCGSTRKSVFLSEITTLFGFCQATQAGMEAHVSKGLAPAWIVTVFQAFRNRIEICQD